MSQPASDAHFAAGVRLFNHEDFFEAHDVWEQVWKNAEGEEKTFYQGLIQAAAFASRFNTAILWALFPSISNLAQDRIRFLRF